MAVAEQLRQRGRHALLILDDLGCMVGAALSSLRPAVRKSLLSPSVPQAEVWEICWRALSSMLPQGHGEEQVQFADMMLTANEAERRRCSHAFCRCAGWPHKAQAPPVRLALPAGSSQACCSAAAKPIGEMAAALCPCWQWCLVHLRSATRSPR